MEKIKIVVADHDVRLRQQLADFVAGVAKQGRVKIVMYFVRMAKPTPAVIGIYGEASKHRRRLHEMLYTRLCKTGSKQVLIATKAADTTTARLQELNDGVNFILHCDNDIPVHFRLATTDPNTMSVSGVSLRKSEEPDKAVDEAPVHWWHFPWAWLVLAVTVAAGAAGLRAALQ